MSDNRDYFKAFSKVSRAFATASDTEQILDLIVESSIETMDGKAACLFLADEEEDIFVPKAQKGLSEDYLHAKPMRARTVVDDILQGGHLEIFDATTDPRLENHEEKKREGITSILVVPVMVRGQAIGVLSLYSKSPRQFTPDEVEFQKALAEQGGIAVERARLIERIEKNIDFFLDFTSDINSSLDIKHILHILTSEVAEALNLKGVDIRLYNKTTRTLDLVASYGLSEEFLNKGIITATKAVASTMKGETVEIEDAATDPRLQYPEATRKEGIVSIVQVPIRARDEVIGLMGLSSAFKRKFPEDVIKFVKAVAHQGGLAIENASLYLALQEEKKDLEKDIWSHKAWF